MVIAYGFNSCHHYNYSVSLFYLPLYAISIFPYTILSSSIHQYSSFPYTYKR